MKDTRADHSEYMTVPEVAQLLRVSQRTVRRWIQSAEIPVVRVSNGVIRFQRDSIQRWLADLEAGAGTTDRPV